MKTLVQGDLVTITYISKCLQEYNTTGVYIEEDSNWMYVTLLDGSNKSYRHSQTIIQKVKS